MEGKQILCKILTPLYAKYEEGQIMVPTKNNRWLHAIKCEVGRQVKYFPGLVNYGKEKILEVAKYQWKDLKAAEGTCAT